MDDKKKIAAMLVMKMKPKGGPGAPMPGKPPPMDKGLEMPSDEPEDEEGGSDHEMAAHEIMDAIKSGDASGLAEALKSFVKMCDYPEDDESSADEG